MKLSMLVDFKILKDFGDGEYVAMDSNNAKDVSIGGFSFAVGENIVPFDWEKHCGVEEDKLFSYATGAAFGHGDYELDDDCFEEDYANLGIKRENISAEFLSSVHHIEEFYVNFEDGAREVGLGYYTDNAKEKAKYKLELVEISFEDGENKISGDPTEIAIVNECIKLGKTKRSLYNEFERINDIPFDSTRKMMTTIHKIGTKYRIITKGAPDVLLKKCSKYFGNDEILSINSSIVNKIENQNELMGNKALRVIAVAYKDIDVFINNAGFGAFGPFYETDMDKEIKMIDVNVKAMHILTKLYLKDMKEKNSGYILNTASAAAYAYGPLMATYYASKSYVYKLTTAIYEELRREKSNVVISCLTPGPVYTKFQEKANVTFTVSTLDSSYVGKYAVDNLFKKKLLIVPGFMVKISRIFSTFPFSYPASKVR